LPRGRTCGEERWARYNNTFVAGVVGFLVTLSLFLEFAGWRGIAVVGAIFAYLMVHLYRGATRPSVVGALGTHP